MGEILNISDVTRARRCTVCHVAGSPEKLRTDGVACEACHGPAEQWLGPHTRADSHDASVKAGMIDLRNLEVRANTCLACHLGSGEQVVNHELIAAGHPDLAFELDTFGAAQPAHYRPREAAVRLRAWAVGQSVTLANAMRQLASHAEKGWPEFSHLECYQCHHDLRAESWRIQRGYAGRTPGSLQINTARFEVMRSLVAAAATDQKAAFEAALARVSDGVSARFTDGAAIAQAARGVETVADSLTARWVRQEFDAQALLRAVTGDIQRISNGGVNAAEQAVMTLDALRNALGRRPEPMAALYDYLEHPSVYRPAGFVALFRKAAGE